LTTTNVHGNTVITAASTGFQSAFVSVNTVTPSGLASALKVFPSPSNILSNPGENDGIIYVELQDATGLPAKSATDVSVQLSTSNPLIVGLTTTNVTIPAGEIFTTLNYILPSSSTGSVTISAFASGFTSGNGVINVVSAPVGNTPCCKVALQGILESPGQNLLKLPADGESYTALELLLQDALGDPVHAPSGGILVQLSSSKASVLSVPTTILIPSGSVFAVVYGQTSFLAGQVNVTAFAQGYSGSSALVETDIPAPSKLTVYVAPTPKILNSLDKIQLVVQLQDAVGNPARAKADTSIYVTSSNSSVVPSTLLLAIPKGDDFVSTSVQASEVGSTTFTASSSGLSSSQTQLTVLPLPIVANMAAGANTIINTQTVPVTIAVTLDGTPLIGATVTWSTSSGNLSSVSSTTNSYGVASVTFTPKALGVANITAVVNAPAIGQSVGHAFVTVMQAPPPTQPTLAQDFISYSYLLLIPIAAIVIFVVIRIRTRRAKRRAELEAAFQTVG
jgi:hypothetical protein